MLTKTASEFSLRFSNAAQILQKNYRRDFIVHNELWNRNFNETTIKEIWANKTNEFWVSLVREKIQQN